MASDTAPPDTPTDTSTDTSATVAELDAIADRLLAESITALEVLTVHVGLELGLYAALADGPMTSGDLAERAGISSRYAREWLEQQTAAGWLTCEDPSAEPEARRFALPSPVASVLLDENGGAYLAPLVAMVRGITDVLDPLMTAFRTGGGVPYEAYGRHIRHGIGQLNGPTFDAALTDWLAGHTDIHDRLTTTGHPKVLDIGCGIGRSTLAIARAYPRAAVHGIDLDAASIEEARAAAEEAGLSDRVTFEVADAAAFHGDHGYDLVTIFEALHDTGDPIGVLQAARAALNDGGIVHVADELVADHFGDGFDPLERLQYGFSVLHCLPATLAEDPVLAHGTILRAPTLLAWAEEAGFGHATALEIDDPFWRHYRLEP